MHLFFGLPMRAARHEHARLAVARVEAARLHDEERVARRILAQRAVLLDVEARAQRLRTPVNNIEYFPPNFEGACSRLYRRRFLQVNTRWKALAEIYTMHSFAPFSNLNFFVKNRQNFFAIELMNIH